MFLAAPFAFTARYCVLPASALALQQSVARSAKGHRGRWLYCVLFCCERIHRSSCDQLIKTEVSAAPVGGSLLNY
jgi:hypothetical protein